MIKINIRCSPLSRKILLRECGHEPIAIRRNNALYDVLRSISTYKENTELAATVVFETTPSMASLLRQNFSNAPLSMHRYHLDMMCRFIFSLVQSGMTAKAAVSTFYAIYRIDEDDYYSDNAYRQYQRFRQALDKISVEKNVEKLHLSVIPNSSHFQPEKPLSEEDCEMLHNHVFTQIMQYYPNPPQQLSKHLHLYIYRTKGQKSIRWCIKRFGLRQSQIYAAVQRIRKRLDTEPAFNELIFGTSSYQST